MQEHIIGHSIALLELATERKKITEFKKQSQLILDSLNGNEKYIDILNSKSIDFEIKQKLINSAFSKKVDKDFKNYILLITEKYKIHYLIPTLHKLISLINEKLGIHEGIVYSVVKLSSKDISEIEKETSRRLKLKINLRNKIDHSIISGIKIEVEGIVIQNNVASKLADLKNKLLEGQVD